jgi:4-hydroxy-tetrahydrodipicolinate synthase
MKTRLSGVFTALVTPFSKGKVDLDRFRALARAQIDAKVAGLVPVGTTGEAATLTDEEAESLIRATVEEANGRCFVMAGAGSNNTAEAVKKARRAEELGVDGLLVVTPYYNKPTQRGLIQHFSAVASAVEIPVMLYSVPGRTGVEIAPATAATLARQHDNIVAIKEAGGQAARVTALRLALGDDFVIHSGDDALTLPFLSLGADGVTSVASNLIPAEMVALVDAWRSGDVAKAKALHYRVSDLVEHLFIETNPVPVKAAMAMRGSLRGEVRLPLAGLSEESEAALRESLSRFDAE